MGVFRDFQTELEQGSKEDIALRNQRNLKIFTSNDNNIIQISSYGQECYLNVKGVFLGKIGLNKETLHTSSYERNKLKAIFGVMNIINRAKKLGKQIGDKSADNFSPYHIDEFIRNTIQIENGMKDLHVIKASSLTQYAKPFGMSEDQLAKLIVAYLNKAHKKKYAPNARTNRERILGK